MVMSKIMQNLVVLVHPFENDHDISLKVGNMLLNRFCVDEDAAFELSGVHYLETSFFLDLHNEEFDAERTATGKGYFREYFIGYCRFLLCNSYTYYSI